MQSFRDFWRGLATAAGLLSAVVSTAAAQTAQLSPANNQSILHLSETAQRDVPRDLLARDARG